MTNLTFEKFSRTSLGRAIDDHLQRILRKAKGGIVIFLSRKGYWLYRVYRRYAGWDESLCKDVTIISDRYVKKWSEEDWNGKKFYIVDDTVTTGGSMFDIFQKVREQYPNSSVSCIALFMRMSNQELRELMMENKMWEPEKLEKLEDFLAHLTIYDRVSLEQIGWLSYEQIHLFQKLLVPYVVDLPLLTDGKYVCESKEPERDHHYSQFDSDVFEALLRMEGDWKYEDNSYLWNNLLDEEARPEKIQCGFFRYTNPNVYSRVGDALFLIIVKCRYEQNEQGGKNLVFTPFAIVNSMRFEDAFRLCKAFYRETPFGKWLEDNEREINIDSHHVLLLRAVVYFLSLYGWSAFQREAEACIGRELPMKLDTSMMCESSPTEFIETAEEIGKWTREDFLQVFQEITPVNNGQLFIRRKIGRVKEEIKGTDFDKAYLLIYESVIERKRQNQYKPFISIEELYKIIDDAVEGREEIKKTLLTKILTRMLDQSVLGNAIICYEENEEGMINRGFRFGENSDIALPFYNAYIYYGVESLYSRCAWKAVYDSEETKKLFFQNISLLFCGIRNMAVKNGYFDVLFDEACLNSNEQYFSNKDAGLRVLVENKKFRIKRDKRLATIEQDIDFCVDELIKL